MTNQVGPGYTSHGRIALRIEERENVSEWGGVGTETGRSCDSVVVRVRELRTTGTTNFTYRGSR